jgi:mitochondrial import inner membrane translocase subunit TIM44
MFAAKEEVRIHKYHFDTVQTVIFCKHVFFALMKRLQVKESFGVRKEESTSCMDGSPEASKHEKTEASSHSNDTSEYATNIHTLFSKLKSTITSASPVVSGAFAKLKDTNLAKQGYGVVKDELSSSSSRKKKKKHQARHASAKVERVYEPI